LVGARPVEYGFVARKGRMLQIRKKEEPNIIGHRKSVTSRVGGHERSPLLIEFDFTVCLDDLWTVAVRKTARQ
jgi:hypothetical protein